MTLVCLFACLLFVVSQGVDWGLMAFDSTVSQGTNKSNPQEGDLSYTQTWTRMPG